MSMPISWLVQLSFWLRSKVQFPRFARAVARCETTQRQFLAEVLRRNADTAFGKEHQFGSIASAEDYARQVPLRDYEGHRPWMERLIAGEKRVLTDDEPFMFATTSGTTDLPKLVPVNEAWKKQTTSVMSMWLAMAQQSHSGMLRHKILAMASPAVEGYTEKGVPIGSVSGLTRERMPRILKQMYSVPYEATGISDYDAKYFVTMRYGLATQVSLMATPNPSTLIRLAGTGNEFKEDLIRAIHDGDLGINLAETNTEESAGMADLQARLESGLSPDPARAKVLEKIVQETGQLRPRDAWPHLKLLGCWLGGSAGIQSRLLSDWYGDVPRRDIGFRATEATMSLPISDNTAAGVLGVHTNFYEFVPEEHIEEDHPPALLAHQLEKGKRYYILLTTSAGLYRYDINDIIEVTNFWRGCPLIAFVQKGRDMTNITGEKLHANQVMIAAERAAEITKVRWMQIQAIPDIKACRYDLLLEPKPGYTHGELERFVQVFDEELRRCNEEYEVKRKSKRLHMPLLHEMRPGWAERIQKADVLRTGKRDSQYKWRVLRDDWMEESPREIERELDAPTAIQPLPDIDRSGADLDRSE